jgi:hypothetical protein
VLVHARALLTSTPSGTTAYLDADLYEPAAITAGAAETLDFDQPIALMLMGITGHVADYDQARSIVRRLLEALPPGSHLVHHDSTNTDPDFVVATDRYNATGAVPYILRSPEQVAGFFEGLELLEPGVVTCTRWRPEASLSDVPPHVDIYGGVGRKP